MKTISGFMVADHERCDGLFAEAEAAVAIPDWTRAAERYGSFHAALLHHVAMEEDVMFPAFEDRTGMRRGPTAVMRAEHRQMMELLGNLADAIEHKNAQAFLGNADTLLVLMQQHNLKEEQMLYQMADQVLVNDLETIVERMSALP